MTTVLMFLAAVCWFGMFAYLAFSFVGMTNPVDLHPRAFSWQTGIWALFGAGAIVFGSAARISLPDDGLRVSITWQPGVSPPDPPPIPPAAE